MELEHLKSFAVVARIGNLSSAAKELGMTQPNLGRHMRILAKKVNMDLFARHSRGLKLTADGNEFLELCQQTTGHLDRGATLIRERKTKPKGILKIVVGTAVMERILEHIPPLCHKYPDLDFKFVSITDALPFQTGDADVGLVSTLFSEPDIVQHHLYNGTFRLYASPNYLKKHPLPKTLADLKHHKLIIYKVEDPEINNTHNILAKHFSLDHTYRNHIEVNNVIALRGALIQGLGIGSLLYDHNLMDKKLLVDVFPDIPDHNIPYYYTYHKSLEGSLKIQVFYEFLKEVSMVWQRIDKQ
jgi:DNA-binding transcriptional LysR family regulator